jgi:metal-responsive CopG/Arc/MetJ family transcriptional regulator
MIDLKAALAERRKSAESALRINVCLSRDLVDEFEELDEQRTQIIASFEMRRQGVAKDLRMGDDPAQLSGVIDAQQSAATADVDAKIADVQARGTEYTVQLVFAVLPPTEYQALVNVYLKGDAPDIEEFSAALLRQTFRGVQQSHEPVDPSGGPGATWDDVSAALSFGEVDRIGQQVLMANRGTVAAPFSRKSSATNH